MYLFAKTKQDTTFDLVGNSGHFLLASNLPIAIAVNSICSIRQDSNKDGLVLGKQTDHRATTKINPVEERT